VGERVVVAAAGNQFIQDILEGRQPEKVKFYKLENDSFLLDILEMSEVQQTLDLQEIFK
jgi:hypothetical protein